MSTKYTPYICSRHLILSIVLFKPESVLDQILSSTASTSVNLGPKSFMALGLVQSLSSRPYLHGPYLGLARV